jgi:WD40 repeat protein
VYDWINHSLKQTFLLPEGSRPTQVAYNGSSNWVHVGSRCGSIHSWKWSADSNNGNRAKNEPLKTLTGHKLSVTSLACTFDQPQMLVSGSRDNFVKLWDMTIGKCIGSCEISRNLSTGMKWIKNEWSLVQSSEDKTLRVWDVRTCTVVQRSQARRHILLCCDASSSNGNHLLSGSSGDDNNGGDLILWDRRNLTKGPIIEYNGHTNNINGCLFMTESTQPMLCSCSTDNTVRLWDYASNGQLLKG